MHLFTEEKYPNFLPKITLTSREIEKNIAPYVLKFFQYRPKRVEGGMELPLFVEAFYRYILEKNKIPEQDEFFKYYLKINLAHFRKLNLDQDTLKGLRARVYRIYPSLVRDIHFAVYLREQIPSAIILYNQQLDMEGTDIMLFHGNQNYGVRLFVNTQAGNHYKDKKDKHQNMFDNVSYIDIPLDMKKAKVCGEFMLYGDKDLQTIKNSLVSVV